MSKDKIMICELETGECVSVEEINSKTVKALKNWYMFLKGQKVLDYKFEVVKCEDKTLKEYFENYINKKILGERWIVGVNDVRLSDLCYLHNDIRPLHIAQSLSCNIGNLQTAIRNKDYEWVKELNKKRHELYTEAFRDWNLNMTEINSYAWSEFQWNIEIRKELLK